MWRTETSEAGEAEGHPMVTAKMTIIQVVGLLRNGLEQFQIVQTGDKGDLIPM